MKHTASLAFVLLFGATSSPPAVQPPLGEAYPCKVVNVVDGDTIDVVLEPRSMRVRLENCWTRETHRVTKDANGNERPHDDIEKDLELGLLARSRMKELAEDRDAVVYVPYRQDIGNQTTLGRVLGYVYVGGKSLSEEMVKSGLASRQKNSPLGK